MKGIEGTQEYLEAYSADAKEIIRIQERFEAKTVIKGAIGVFLLATFVFVYPKIFANGIVDTVVNIMK